MVKNMEKRETLRQYLTYNKDVNKIENIFLDLDKQMKYLHQKGYCVAELNSDSIVLEQRQYSSGSSQELFVFASIAKTNNENVDFLNNITDLSKLAIGAYISSENGFCDYSRLSTDYIKKYFNEIAFYLPNSEYFSNVINEGDISYYSDYVQRANGNSRSNSIQKTKVNEYGKMYVSEDNAAFIQIVFYPVIIISIITVIAVLSKILN